MILLIALLGCDQNKETIVEGYALSSEVLDFGVIPIDTWQEQAISLENLGNAPFTLLSVGIVDASEYVWGLDREEISELQSGEYTTFTIRFSPLVEDPSIARLQIRTSMAETPILYVQASGEGSPSILDQDGDGFSPADGDCNDNNNEIFPGTEEVCDGKDSNCDDILPEDEEDVDNDGFATCQDDCDDLDADVYPGAPELCDDLDNNCDGIIPDNDDLDGDGQSQCDNDCDDNDPNRWWGNEEICDYIDNNCSGIVDDLDEDGDGHSACPSGGDCNDRLSSAYPVVFDSTASLDGNGSPEYPYSNINAAIENLDTICRTIMVKPGTHTVSAGWSGGLLRVVGAAEYPDDVTLIPEEVDRRIFTVYEDSELELEGLTLFGADVLGFGGALFTNRGRIAIGDSIILGNESNTSGGAIAVLNGILELNNVDVSYNTAQGSAGGIHLDNSTLIAEDITISNNVSIQGAGVEMFNSIATITNGQFSYNLASGEGGGLAVYEQSSLNMTQVDFIENETASNGAGILLRNITSPSIIRNGIFQGNGAGEFGGGIAVVGTDGGAMIANNTFIDNVAIIEGADVHSAPTFSSEGLWVWGNIFGYSDSSSSVYLNEESAGQVAFNSCTDPVLGNCFVIPIDADIGYNAVQDPLFADFSNDQISWNDDLSLQLSSPVIDAGPLNGTGASFYNDWEDVDGTRNDQGHLGGPEGER